MLNHQRITSSHNEAQRSPWFVQKQRPEVFYKKKVFLKISQILQENTCVGASFNNFADLQACNFIKKIFQQCFLMKFAKLLRTPIFKNICERLLLFVSPQNTITNSSGEFGLDETSTECKVSIFLKVTILFNQMQPHNLYVS